MAASNFKLSQVDRQIIRPLVLKCRDLFYDSAFVVDLYLVGSAANDSLNDHSDIDFVVVIDQEKNRKSFQKSLHPHYPLSTEWEIEIIIVSKVEFDRLSKIGGICYDAVKEGIKLERLGEIRW